jgi:hypothetical protein
MVDVIKETSKGRLVYKVIHGFIEGNVLRGKNIQVQDIFHRLREIKENIERAHMCISE